MRSHVSTKSFYEYPCCHRQPKHDGHCKFLHGYSRSFHMWFSSSGLDDNGFVMDFSGMSDIKSFLSYYFDHTTLINEDDPELDFFKLMNEKGLILLRVLPNVSMESTAEFVLSKVNELIKYKNPHVLCFKVEVKENKKNSGIYELNYV